MLTYTLVADGSSDEVLIPIIDWTINQNFPDLAYAGMLATDLPSPRHGLAARAAAAVKMFPCDVLVIHRDSEGQALHQRYEEILKATGNLSAPSVPMVPVRMTEAWLLISAEAIRRAAGNPAGTRNLLLPSLQKIEATPDPKNVLFDALMAAADLGARRRAGFNAHAKRRRVAECIGDFSRLRSLNSFKEFEQAMRTGINAALSAM